MAAPAPVLRPEATLVGRSIVPFVLKTGDADEATPADDRLARFDADVPLSQLEPRQILDRIGALTGEAPEVLLRMAGRDPGDRESINRLAHFAILEANGFPDGQEVSSGKAAKEAAQASLQLLADKTAVTARDNQAKHPPPPGGSSDDLPGPSSGKPPSKRKRRKADSSASDSSDGEELEDDAVRVKLGKLRKVCLDPNIHLYPMKMGSALTGLIEAGTRVKHKRLLSWNTAWATFMEHTTSEGIGEEVWKLVQTKEERRLAGEKEKAKASLRARQNATRQAPKMAPPTWAPPPPTWAPPPPTWAPPPYPPKPSHASWGGRPNRGGFFPPNRGPSGRSDRRCYNCNRRGHIAVDCDQPPRHP
ncbi:uncharacterized protein LOC144885618 [Branchiostoma floridae x Branchiostoma japonicum]